MKKCEFLGVSNFSGLVIFNGANRLRRFKLAKPKEICKWIDRRVKFADVPPKLIYSPKMKMYNARCTYSCMYSIQIQIQIQIYIYTYCIYTELYDMYIYIYTHFNDVYTYTKYMRYKYITYIHVAVYPPPFFRSALFVSGVPPHSTDAIQFEGHMIRLPNTTRAMGRGWGWEPLECILLLMV